MLHQIDMQHTKFKATTGVQPRLIHSTPCKKSISPSMSMWETNNESYLESVLEQSTATIVTGDAVRKISALEDELNRLRAQIAGFVLKQEEPASNTGELKKDHAITYIFNFASETSRECLM